jgi:hypothetical protein
MDEIAKSEAMKLLGLNDKQFENFYKVAEEFHPLPRRRPSERIRFNRKALLAWKNDYDSRMITLTKGDYLECLDFAMAQHFRGYVLSDWGSARQREFGQKITNWVKGQLGEIAFKKYMKAKFGVRLELDFEIHDEIVPQDVTSVSKNGREWRKPRMKVAIKSSKPKSAFLVLSPNEVELPNRSSDIYVYCRPDLDDDHLLRITSKTVSRQLRNERHYRTYSGNVPSFREVPCEIAGFAFKRELKRVDSIPGQDFDGWRYVIESGRLHRSSKDWKGLANSL